MQAADSRSLVPKAVEDALRPRTEATLRAAMSEFKQQFGSQPKEEYKITVLVCNSDDAKTQEAEVSIVHELQQKRGAHWVDCLCLTCHVATGVDGYLLPHRSASTTTLWPCEAAGSGTASTERDGEGLGLGA